MTNKDAIEELKNMAKFNYTLAPIEVFEMAIQALELLDTLTDRPCSVCRHHKERTEFEVGGCCKWDCVFDGHIGGRK